MTLCPCCQAAVRYLYRVAYPGGTARPLSPARCFDCYAAHGARRFGAEERRLIEIGKIERLYGGANG